MAYSVEKLQKELSALSPSAFADLFRDIRGVNGAAVFNKAFFTPFQIDDEQRGKYSKVLRDYGIKGTLSHPLDVQDVMMVLMAEAVERSTRTV